MGCAGGDAAAVAREVALRLDERDPRRDVRWRIAPGLHARCDAGLLRTVFDRRVRRLGLTRAQWLVLNEATLGLETGSSIASKTGVSEITVSRFLKRAGYKGLQGLKEDLQAALVHAHVSPADRYFRLLDSEIGAILKRDADAVLAEL